MSEIQNKMRQPIEDSPGGVFEVVDEALNGTKAIPIVFVTKGAANSAFSYGGTSASDASLNNEMRQPIEGDSVGNFRVVDEDADGRKAIPFVAVTKDATGKFVYASIGGGGGSAVAWDDITDKPATFTPATHSHTIAQVTSLQTTLDGKAPTSHTHTIAQVTSLQASLDAKLTATKAAAQSDSVAADAAALVADFNALLAKLRAAGIMA